MAVIILPLDESPMTAFVARNMVIRGFTVISLPSGGASRVEPWTCLDRLRLHDTGVNGNWMRTTSIPCDDSLCPR